MGLSLHISIVPLIMMVVSLQLISLPLGCLEEERAALLNLKDSLNYPNGTSLPTWRKGDARCCDWYGVECGSGTGRVTELYLGGFRNGELGDWYLNASLFLPFQELISLYLWGNQIAGVYQPFKMSKLQNLDLRYNRLDNSILSYVDGLSSLKTLYLSYNRLEGLIDLKVNELLNSIMCCGWELVGCMSGTGRVTRLDLLGVRNGELGDWYLNASLFLPFQELSTLYLSDNQIAGWVENKDVSRPFKMSKLEYLYLSDNRLNNSILSCVDGLSSLKTLDISYNRLEGLIDLKECPSGLETLNLGDNNITKVVASGGPTNLSALYLFNITAYGSSFQTSLQSLGALPNLMTLDLGYNDLRGRVLGDDLRNLSSLEELVLDYCSLDENSLQSLEALPSLKNLSLQGLSGVVPFQAFLNLKNLELLDLSGNTLNSSNIFQTIGTMTSLKTLMLVVCSLNGQFPTSQGIMVTAAQLQIVQSPITMLISTISTSVNVKLDDTNYLNWHFKCICY